MPLLTELKERKVFRVAAAYAVVAWLLIQVASAVLPALRLPDWTVTFTTMLRLLGTPADRKQRILFDAGHGYLPHNQFVRATLDWYDQYLGPTR
jgi:hypothetical protein